MEHQILIVLPVLPDRSPKLNPLVVWGARSKSLRAYFKGVVVLRLSASSRWLSSEALRLLTLLQYCSLWYCAQFPPLGSLVELGRFFVSLLPILICHSLEPSRPTRGSTLVHIKACSLDHAEALCTAVAMHLARD